MFRCPEFAGCDEQFCAYPGEEDCYWTLTQEERDMTSKFIQLVVAQVPEALGSTPVLYALDDEGQVWEYRAHFGQWCKMTMVREG